MQVTQMECFATSLHWKFEKPSSNLPVHGLSPTSVLGRAVVMTTNSPPSRPPLFSRRALLLQALAASAAAAGGMRTASGQADLHRPPSPPPPPPTRTGSVAPGPIAVPAPAPSPAEHALKTQSVLYELASGSFLPYSALPHVLRKNLAGEVFDRCLLLGEVHSEIQSHAAQLATIKHAMHLPDHRPLVVAFEQFYRIHNRILAAFVAGDISLDTMLRRTEWNQTWGFDPALYLPIFRFCRQYRIKMVGMNIPSQIVSLVSQVGIDGLPPSLQQILPDRMDLTNQEHRAHFMKAVGFDSGSGEVANHPGAKERIDNWYQAQTIWDEYMSESIADVMNRDENARIIALVGSGHVETHTAIPDRVESRTGQKPFSIVTRCVNWTPVSGISMPSIEQPEKCADIVWYTRRAVDMV